MEGCLFSPVLLSDESNAHADSRGDSQWDERAGLASLICRDPFWRVFKSELRLCAWETAGGVLKVLWLCGWVGIGAIALPERAHLGGFRLQEVFAAVRLKRVFLAFHGMQFDPA